MDLEIETLLPLPRSPPSSLSILAPQNTTIHKQSNSELLSDSANNSNNHSEPPSNSTSSNPQVELSSNLVCLVISIWIPSPHLRDQDLNPPTNNAYFHHLANYYEAHLRYLNSLTGPSLCWTNLIRGLLNNSTWTHRWASMMTDAIAYSLPTPQSRGTIQILQLQNFYLMPPLRLPLLHPPYNSFPLQPIPIRSMVRHVPQPLPLSHIPLHCQGTIVDVYENQSLTMLASPPQRMEELLVSVSSFLKYKTGTLDYRLIFSPTKFTNFYNRRNKPSQL